MLFKVTRNHASWARRAATTRLASVMSRATFDAPMIRPVASRTAETVSDTSIRVGGDELDTSIVQFMRKNYNLLIGEPTAEQIKIQIGSAAPVGEEREMEVKGRDLVSGIPKTVRVHSSEIREAIQEPVQAIVDAVRRALEITPPELASDIVDRGIVMTGGGALLKGLDALLRENTNLPINVDEEPLTCVVRGTGRILDDPDKYRGVLALSGRA